MGVLALTLAILATIPPASEAIERNWTGPEAARVLVRLAPGASVPLDGVEVGGG